MKMKRLTKAVRDGLVIWAGHCQAIMDDKETEFEEAKEQGGETEYDAADIKAMQAAINWMNTA